MDRMSPRDAVYAISMSTSQSVSMPWHVSLSMIIAGQVSVTVYIMGREGEKERKQEQERDRQTDQDGQKERGRER